MLGHMSTWLLRLFQITLTHPKCGWQEKDMGARWTLGIFMFELFYGTTPFKGMDHELTLANIVARTLEFSKEPTIPSAAKDLISLLLAKDPIRRLGSSLGASAVKRHPFFQGVNWAFLMCTRPPFRPPPFRKELLSDEICPETHVNYY
ncbi:unnamed protein product [Eruca vesicaria subsp. sativa]|uniref:non-specific serine/threonine protein kinase n=1 Tax=Eruca vesicaria subsp. sativa TaxID=29727 RepID=A0ABC8IVS8_ERUVS|nr:unnamed protein product [Eruca vesicaria subsp. sativa]